MSVLARARACVYVYTCVCMLMRVCCVDAQSDLEFDLTHKEREAQKTLSLCHFCVFGRDATLAVAPLPRVGTARTHALNSWPPRRASRGSAVRSQARSCSASSCSFGGSAGCQRATFTMPIAQGDAACRCRAARLARGSSSGKRRTRTYMRAAAMRSAASLPRALQDTRLPDQ